MIIGSANRFAQAAGSGGGASGLLLDSYTAELAWSVRLLKTSYSGACVRVRRSSDNAEADIGFASGWIDESALLTHVGTGGTDQGYVVTFYGQTGNEFSDPTPADQYQIVENGVVCKLNGKPVVNDRGGDPAYDLLTGLTTTDGHLFLVNQGLTSGSTQTFLGDAGTVIMPLARSGSPNTEEVRGVGTPTSWRKNGATATVTTRWEAYSWLCDDNQNLLSVASLDLSSVTRVFVSYVSSYRYVGQLQELIIMATNQSASIADIENNINSAFSIY